MANNWILRKEDKLFDPVPLKTLRTWVYDNRVQGRDMVSSDGGKTWSLQIMYDEHYMGWSDARIFYKAFPCTSIERSIWGPTPPEVFCPEYACSKFIRLIHVPHIRCDNITIIHLTFRA